MASREPRTGLRRPARRFDNTELELELRDGRRVPVILGHCRFPADDGGVIYALDLSAFRRAESRRQLESLHAAVLVSWRPDRRDRQSRRSSKSTIRGAMRSMPPRRASIACWRAKTTCNAARAAEQEIACRRTSRGAA
jgi:hypothetical protein